MINDSKKHSPSNPVDLKWRNAARLFTFHNVLIFKLAYVLWRHFSSSTAMSASPENFSRVHFWLIDFSWDLRCLFLVETYYLYHHLSLPTNFICEVYPLWCYNLTENTFHKKEWIHPTFKVWWLTILYFCDTWVVFLFSVWV